MTQFDLSPWQTVDLMQHTDVLLGMHGAGWANAIFLKRGAVGLQLFPYGWEKAPGRFIRGDFYAAMVEAVRGQHLTWANTHAEYAFFRRTDFERAGRGDEWVEHPDPATPTPQVLHFLLRLRIVPPHTGHHCWHQLRVQAPAECSRSFFCHEVQPQQIICVWVAASVQSA